MYIYVVCQILDISIQFSLSCDTIKHKLGINLRQNLNSSLKINHIQVLNFDRMAVMVNCLKLYKRVEKV